MKDDFTVITISYERKVFLKRYLESCAINGFKTILVDGSDLAYEGDTPSNVTYFHMPGERAAMRMAFAMTKVQTPYVVVLADDDYLVPSALQRGMQFLTQNPQYSSYQGKVLTFNERFEKSSILYKSYKAFHQPASLDLDSPLERLVAHMSHYTFTFYSLQKTSIWSRFFKDVYPYLKDEPVFLQKHPAIFELVQSVHCILSGKNKMSDSVYLLRESIPRPTAEVTSNHFYFNETAEFSDFLTKFADVLAPLFDPSSAINSQDLAHVFSLFAQQRRAKSRSGNFEIVGDFAQVCQSCSASNDELSAINQKLESYRDDVIGMLNMTCSESVSYWYDENWSQVIAKKFKTLTRQYGKYVLYGAGEHTQKLAEAVGLGEGVLCLADSNSRMWGKKQWGLECIDPDSILDYCENVIISSQQHETQIAEKLRTKFANRLNISTLYA